MPHESWLDWLLDPEQVLGWLLVQLGKLLSLLPASIGFLGYILGAIWLTRWVLRHVRPMIPDPSHPLFRRPYGARLWLGTGLFRLILIGGTTILGAYLPQALANSLWRPPFTLDDDVPLGMVGRLSQLVGLVCGFIIGCVCQGQLNALVLTGMLAYGLWSVAQWVIGG